MSNRSVIPAFQANVGDWKYYICVMKYGEVARQIQFAHEMNSNKSIDDLIQRGISERTSEITEYILNSEHRFLGSLIVAAYGGDPRYSKLVMEGQEDYMEGMDQGFGVLSFDGGQSYFALDGQHRLKAIKDAVRKNPDLGSEEICVIMVSHFDTPDGRERTRRLFTNINRNAKVTSAGENILLDEDDGSAIIARRLLLEHERWAQEGVVRVFTKQGDNGELKVASSSVPKTDAKAITTVTVLKELSQILCFDQDRSVREAKQRPSTKVLDASYDVVSQRLNDVFGDASGLLETYDKVDTARDLRAPKNREGEGHPLMRPIVQKAVCSVLRDAVTQGEGWSESVQRLKKLDWRLNASPWTSVFNVENSRMITAKENKNLLEDLLRINLVPGSKARVKAVRKEYKDVRGQQYPIGEEDLMKLVITPKD